MKITYRGHEVEFTTAYRPAVILVDGEEYSMERYAASHDGKNWSASANGNSLHYAAANGKEMSVPQKRFQMTDEEWKKLNDMKKRGLA